MYLEGFRKTSKYLYVDSSGITVKVGYFGLGNLNGKIVGCSETC